MVHLRILTGKKAGTSIVTREFPFQIGRASDCDLCLQEPGVWDRHVEIRWKGADGFELFAHKDALTTVQDAPATQTMLRNGDRIDLGSVKLIFGLSPTVQRGLRLRETALWIALGMLSLAQIVLIYWLPG